MRWLCLIAFAISTTVLAEDLMPDQPRTSVNDVLFGEALFSLHSGDYQKALGLNLRLKQRAGKGYGKILDIHKATAQLGLGMSKRAKQQFYSLISSEKSKIIPNKARSQAWFYLSQHFYNKGEWATALKSIRKVKVAFIDESLKDEYHFLAATLELFQGDVAKADSHILGISQNSLWAAYAFTNLAISYTERDIHTSKVEAVFNKALLMTKYTTHPDELVDKINLMAGQFFFSTGRGRSAIKHLKNVSLDSAFTPKALLTYGWALTEQWQYHDALQPWYMLKTSHSPLNQDVQETLIAIPHLLEKLNAKVMALGAFDYATKQYDTIIDQLEKSAKRLNTGEFIEPLLAQQVPDKWGAFEMVDLSLPNHPDGIYLKDVMSQGAFQGELKTLRDLHVMRSQLNKGLAQLDAFKGVSQTREVEYQKVKEDRRIINSAKRLRKFEKRYKQLLAKVKKAFKNPDGRGLASEPEKLQLMELAAVDKRITHLNKLKGFKSQQYKSRLRRAEGIIKWQLSERYLKRKKKVTASLAMLESQFVKARAQHEGAKLAFMSAPKAFVGYVSKSQKLAKKYKKQLIALERTYQKQREKVGSIVKLDIKKRQQRVMDYQLQARLAAARLFDETSNKERSMAATGVSQ